VRDDTDITEVAHLKGRTFAFGSKRSTLGRYFAQTYLADLGIHAKDLGDYDYLSHHEAVGLAVGAGRYEAGVLNRRKAANSRSCSAAACVCARSPASRT
jgi:phosphonate transport system substrate-binding protein